jgi:hypothetical protein
MTLRKFRISGITCQLMVGKALSRGVKLYVETDGERAALALKGAEGKRLAYRNPRKAA